MIESELSILPRMIFGLFGFKVALLALNTLIPSMNFKYLFRSILTFYILVLTESGLSAAAPALRDEVNLNGTWNAEWKTNGVSVSGPVVIPEYQGVSLGSRTYTRSVTVPSSWAGKIIKLDFLGVVHVADVYVNGKHVVQKTGDTYTNIGGWNPFNLDITSLVTAGQTFELKVMIKGAAGAPISQYFGATDGNKYVYPVGFWGGKIGFCDSVYLRAYGRVNLEDTYIISSVQNDSLTLKYTVFNSTTLTKSISIKSDVILPSTQAIVKTISTSVTLNPGERREVVATTSGTGIARYWPDDPKLYHLKSSIIESGTEIDSEVRRFGFREITIVGTQIYWNGIRCNIYGDYESMDPGYHTSGSNITPAGWPATVDRIKGVNIRAMRFHHCPAPQYILDTADEKGLLICSESANYGRFYHEIHGDASTRLTYQTTYINNFNRISGNWIKKDRNHPCIYIWNACNEFILYISSFTPAQLLSMAQTIKSYDSTRPVGFDGDSMVAGQLKNYHYPEQIDKQPPGANFPGSVYTAWDRLFNKSVPNGSGELLHASNGSVDAERNKWWLGIWTRGMRYLNFTDVRPACFFFAGGDVNRPSTDYRKWRGLNLKNAYAPVAAFDLQYDELGISPFVNATADGAGVLPVIQAGSTRSSFDILYNDEFSDPSVTLDITIQSASGTIYGHGSKTFTVPLGEHIQVPYSFQVPNISGQELQLVQRTFKAGVKKFEETRRFTVSGTGSGTTSNIINFPTMPSNQLPIANAGADLTVVLPTNSVTLSGAASSDPDGKILGYTWSRTPGAPNPAGSVFSSQYGQTVKVSGLVEGTYKFRLMVWDDRAGVAYDDVTVQVLASGTPPPPTNQLPSVSLTSPSSSATFTAPATITLAATATDSDGTIDHVEFYNGTTKIGSDTTAPFSLAWSNVIAGTYNLKAVAFDNNNASTASSVVTITVGSANQPPTVELGPDRVITMATGPTSTAAVKLTSTANDQDGQITNYFWELVSGPTSVNFSSPDSSSTTVGGLRMGTYVVRLTVTDNGGLKAYDEVSITINEPPVANAGPDQEITLPTNVVTLSGSGQDADGQIVSYEWIQTSGVTVQLNNSKSASTTVSGLVEGQYGFRLKVVDNHSASVIDDVVITVKPPAPVISSTLSASATSFKPFSYQIVASNNPGKFSATGLPAGMNVNSSGLISGTPTVSGVFNIGISASNAGGTDSKQLVLTINKPKVTLIVSSTALNVGDSAVKSRLESLGFEVTPRVAAIATVNDVSDQDMLVISSTAMSVYTNTKFRDVAIPVVVWEGWLFDDFGMTGPTLGTDYYKAEGQTTISITNSSHPLAANLSGTQTVYSSPGYLEYGNPNSNAVVVATLSNDPTKAVLFGYEKGAQMVGVVAPAKRVGFFTYDTEASVLTPAGWSLFDAAIYWSLK